jgi:hypothetical protein
VEVLFDLEILLGYSIDGVSSRPVSGRAPSPVSQNVKGLFLSNDNENDQGQLVPLVSLDHQGVAPGDPNNRYTGS